MNKEHFLSDILKRESEKKVKITIYFPPDLVKRVKHACVDLEITLSDFIRIAVEEYLKALETIISEKKQTNL